MSTQIDPRPAEGYAGDLTPQQAWDLLAGDPDAVLVDVRTDGIEGEVVDDEAQVGEISPAVGGLPSGAVTGHHGTNLVRDSLGAGTSRTANGELSCSSVAFRMKISDPDRCSAPDQRLSAERSLSTAHVELMGAPLAVQVNPGAVC